MQTSLRGTNPQPHTIYRINGMLKRAFCKYCIRPGLLSRLQLIVFVLILQACSSPDLATPGAAGQGFKNLIPKAALEAQSAQTYQDILNQAKKENKLLPKTAEIPQRLQRIARRIVDQASVWSPQDAKRWNWEVNAIQDDTLNAFVLPGGKIIFYTGLIEKLDLNDNEIAAIMGHEVAHALYEHAREHIGKTQATGVALDIGTQVVTQALGLGQSGQRLAETAAGLGTQLLSVKFSRDNETEADLIGLDLAARAGFNPRAALSVWRKMDALDNNQPPEFLSTHPSNPSRIQTIEKALPQVWPLYQQSGLANQ